LIVRTEEGRTPSTCSGRVGKIHVTAESNGLKTAEIIVNSE